MNRSLHNTENTQPSRANKLPNYAQAARSSQPNNPQQTRASQQETPQQTDLAAAAAATSDGNSSTAPSHLRNTGSSGYHNSQHSYSGQSYKNSYRPKDNTYNNNSSYNKKAPVQLPMAPPTDTGSIQFGSINQTSNTPLPTTAGRSGGEVPVLRTSEVQFGSVPVTDAVTGQNATSNNIHIRPQIRVQQQQQHHHHSQQGQQQQHNQHQKPDIPRSPRTTNDNRLFTQPYAPRQNLNQGDYNTNNNNNNNNNHHHHPRYNSNNNNYNNTRHNNYGRPPPPPNSTSPHHYSTATAAATVIQHSPQHHHHSPQHQQQQLPPSPMSMHRGGGGASPNLNYQQQQQKKNQNISSPHIPHSSPQSIQMTASWSPNHQQYFYSPYPVQVQPYNVIPATRSPIIPQPAPRKVIAIVDPTTGNTLNTNPSALNVSSPSSSHANALKEEKQPDFKIPVPHVSKAVSIVDPAIRDRELREKREREEAEQEAIRKAKEEEEEKKRKEQEEAERKIREEKERLEREEKERNEKKEKERLEKEETERRLAAEAEAIKKAEQEALIAAEKKKAEEEARKAEEEKEAKRVVSELEAKKRREEQDRIIAAEVASQKVGRLPNKLDISTLPLFTASPVSTPMNKTSKKVIEDPSTIQYPPGIKAPTKDDGKFTYSIDFLLQFQQLCLETEQDLSAIMNEMGANNSNNNNSMRQYSDRGKTPRTPGTPGAHNPMSGDSMFRMGSRDGRMEMGKFNMGRPLTARMNSTTSNNSHMMERQGSARGGMSHRGGRGGGQSGMKIFKNPMGQQPPQQQGAPTIPIEQVAPLEKSENRWVPATQTVTSIQATTGEDELMTQEFITRKVNALLNKLTLERFDSIATQIFEYAKQSAKEEDGRSLRTVMKLTFEKACDEPAFASMWARLCRTMYDSMTDDIRDTSILNEAKQPSSGVLLFRKYLFNRCQVEFEKGWKVNMPKADEVEDMMTEEYYAAVKAKRQGLGLIQFIGELFKLDMLSERIMYSCMIRLCNDPANAGDEEAESLCKLLTTIGKALDSKIKTSKWVDVVVGRMKNEMVNSPKLTSRVKFMIQDLLDLRRDKWVPRNATGNPVGPTTIAKIHEMAEKAKEEKEAAAAMKRNNSTRGQYIPNNNNQYNNNAGGGSHMARTGSYRGGRDQHHFQPHNNNSNNNNNGGASDGWSTVTSPGGVNANTSGSNKTRPTDLSNFGRTDRSRSKTNILGPSNSPFPSLSRGKSATNIDSKASGDGRSSPATNMFSALLNGGEKTEERKKLQLAPRTIDTSLEDETQSSEAPKQSDDAIKRKSKNILEEYFSIRDKRELSECVKELDDPHYLELFIGEMLTVVEKKATDVQKMIEVIQYLDSEKLLEKELYIRAFKSFMEGYDDLTIDVPQAPKYVAQILYACSITPEEVDKEGFDSLKNAYQKVVVEAL